MGIFILIICCFYTLSGLNDITDGVDKDASEYKIVGVLKLVLGILAIIFQSLRY